MPSSRAMPRDERPLSAGGRSGPASNAIEAAVDDLATAFPFGRTAGLAFTAGFVLGWVLAGATFEDEEVIFGRLQSDAFAIGLPFRRALPPAFDAGA